MTTLKELTKLLKEHNIPIHRWKFENGVKTIDNLLNEINSGETKLVIEDGSLIRKVKVVNILVHYKNEILIEDKQVFNNGKTRHRNLNGVSEKVMDNEPVYNAAFRGLEEELGIVADYKRLNYINHEKELKMSNSYYGLYSKYDRHIFKYTMDDNEYKDSYIEEQEDKKTYFKWTTL